MMMLKERDNALCVRATTVDTPRRPSWFFPSFFMELLLITDKKYCYANIKRWSKNFDVFEMDKIFFPINLSNTHWAMAVVCIQKLEIHYYDSMSGNGKSKDWLDGLLQWLVDEALDKKRATLDTSKWCLLDCEEHVPQQNNGVDCGVFALMCADFLSDNLPLTYTQDNMAFFRRKIAADIIRGSLQYPV
jgi:sentrin-specific protease 1